jgi:hypothetical protein
MLKKFSVIFLLTLFLLSSVNVFAKTAQKDNLSAIRPVSLNLLSPGVEDDNYLSAGKVYLGPTLALGRGQRQLYNTETTQRDRQHYVTMGRQIVYAGWYNAACDYVFMDYTYRQGGATLLYFVRYAIFSWGGMHTWDYECQPPTNVSPNSSLFCNIDATPDLGIPVVAYHHGADNNSPWYNHIGYSNECLGCAFPADTLPGPPNDAGIQTGYCGDTDDIVTPYVWPHIEVDTNDAGMVVTHVGSFEGAGCPVGDDQIENGTLVYYRKVATVDGQPWTGTWEGPIFMDSCYDMSYIVRADKNSNDVYFAYLRPLYFQTGSTHPCEANGLGHYQITHEVVYKKSINDGASWGPTIYVTDFASGFEERRTEPATYDLSGMVDPTGVFHLVWASGNRDPENECSMYYASKMWHWDNFNNCISVAYDASHPRLFTGDVGAWNNTVNKYSISWCDEKLYIVFNRFGAHPVGDTSFDAGLGDGINIYQNGDILIVGSDVSGGMGKTWTDAIDLTDTPTPDCEAGDCLSEHWPSMAMYSSDSLMIEYILDLDPGAYGTNDEGSIVTDNPVIFMTWPCFTMADVGTNICYTMTPDPPEWPEVALAPNGQTAGCTTPATYSDDLILSNCGNVDLTYTTLSDAAWLTVTGGAAGTISAGAGPRGADDPSWSGASGCASPATITWTANSATLAAGNYQGTIAVDLSAGDDFDIVVNVVVACSYFEAEWARLSSGCWTVDVWNTPQAGHQNEEDGHGNMMYYACGGDSTYVPLYNEGFIVGWNNGTVSCYSFMNGPEFEAGVRALDSIQLSSVGNPSGGNGYWKAYGAWCTVDSCVYGTIEYYVPGHQDTAILIEKVRLWSECGALSNFIAGEGIDWDVRQDSNYDAGGVDLARNMAYQRGCRLRDSIVAGLSPYFGHNSAMSAAVVDNHDYIYDYGGYDPDSIFAVLDTLDNGPFTVFQDSCTDLNSIFKFWEGSLAVGDTLEFIKIKAVSLDGIIGLQQMIDKGVHFVGGYPGIFAGEVEAEEDTVSVNAQAEGKAVINVPVAITEARGARIWWTAQIDAPAPAWLSIDPEFPDFGVTPGTLTITVNTAGLAVGTYFATITLVAPGAVNSPITITVKLEISEGGCEGICGDANSDATVNVSDAVYIINYVFVGGGAPVPLACGDANSDGTVNVSDAVYIINYVFVGGGAPEDCSPGSINWEDGDCCPFVP